MMAAHGFFADAFFSSIGSSHLVKSSFLSYFCETSSTVHSKEHYYIVVLLLLLFLLFCEVSFRQDWQVYYERSTNAHSVWGYHLCLL